MQKLSKEEYKLFESIVGVNQKTLLRILGRYLDRKYKRVIKTEDYIYAIGDIPVGLVAHMDTVFDKPPTNIYYDEKKNVLWSPEGLGADDRAGIFAIIKILQTGLRPSVIFTTEEEKGGIGAMKLVEEIPEPLSPLNYLIELDRRGKCDCVFYDCINTDFIDYVESFGFIEAWGSFSDICDICYEWGMAGVNLSIGYEDEHTYVETFHVAPWRATIGKVIKMLREENIPKFEYIEDTKWRKYLQNYQKGWFYEQKMCSGCNEVYDETDMIPVEVDGHTLYYCPDCCVDKVDWCNDCGEAVLKSKINEHICKNFVYGGHNPNAV